MAIVSGTTGAVEVIPGISFGGVEGTAYRFTGNGSITFSEGGEVDYLLVAGGGGGSASQYAGGNAGSAGAVLEGQFLATASAYAIIVGDGGAAQTSRDHPVEAADGGNSSIAGANAPSPAIGGEGGNSDYHEDNGWGGNGAGGPGDRRDNMYGSPAGYGGVGFPSGITGSTVVYGGGGGGGTPLWEDSWVRGLGGDGGGGDGGDAANDATPGEPNTGGGGGGNNGHKPETAGNGGSGVVVLFVPNAAGPGEIVGAASVTLAPAGAASSARLAIRGATARTLAGVARSSTARIRVRANAAQPLAAATASSSGALANRGNVAQQLDSATVIATGEQQALAPIAAAVSITLESAAVSANATTNAIQPDQPGWTGGGGSHATEADERRRRTAIRDAIETARRQIDGEPLPGVADASQPATSIERTAPVAEPIQYSALALLEGQGWAVSLSEIAHELEMLRAILIEQQQAEEDDEAAVLALLLAA